MGETERLRLAVLGTDTGVGKTMVVDLLCRGLRALGRRVWLHKPVACGDWRDGMAEDGRRLLALCADGQDPDSICPWQFPLAAAPNVALRAAGGSLDVDHLLSALRGLLTGDHDLLYEGVGGILAPLCDGRATIVDILRAEPLPVLLVTRPHLGTINHTALSVAHLRERGLRVVGLVVNEHEAVDHDDPAVASAAEELSACCRLPVLAWLPHGAGSGAGEALARALLSLETPA